MQRLWADVWEIQVASDYPLSVLCLYYNFFFNHLLMNYLVYLNKFVINYHKINCLSLFKFMGLTSWPLYRREAKEGMDVPLIFLTESHCSRNVNICMKASLYAYSVLLDLNFKWVTINNFFNRTEKYRSTLDKNSSFSLHKLADIV